MSIGPLTEPSVAPARNATLVKPTPVAVSPEGTIGAVLGFIVLLALLAAAQSVITGERREWIVYVVASLTTPIVALVVALAAPGLLRRGVASLLIGVLLLFVVAGVAMRASVRLEDGTGRPTPSQMLVLPAALTVLAVAGWLAARFHRKRLERLTEAESRTPESRWGWLFPMLCVIATSILLRTTRYWFDWRILFAFLFLAALSWLTWRAWYAPETRVSPKASRVIDGVWYGLFALATLIPLYQPGIGAIHHWSFYLGPISLVKEGRLLLWEVPSQYGFLSVFLPAWLPFRQGGTGMYVLHATFLAIEAVVLYRMICHLREGTAFRLWAGLTTLITVYFFSGDRENLGGVWELPNAGIYRFFWVTMLGMYLATFRTSPSSSRSVTVQSAGTSLLVAFGTLWSVESGIYVLGTLGVTALAELIMLITARSGRTAWLSWIQRFLVPVGALALMVAGISIYYRMRFGFAADWSAFVEYGASYARGFGSIPIDPAGVVLLLALVVSSVLAYAMSEAVETQDPSSAGLFAPFGAMISTLSYFVSRSGEHCAVMAVWFPLLIVTYCIAVKRRGDGWLRALRTVMLPLSVVMTTLVFCLNPPALGRAKAFVTQLPALTVDHALSDEIRKNFALAPVIQQKIGDLPLINLTGYHPTTKLPYLPNPPWLPISPREEFFILDPSRQREYIERFITRRAVPEGILFRRDPPAWDPEDWQRMHKETIKVLDETLPRHYQLVETLPLDDGYRLERWKLRSETSPSERSIAPSTSDSASL